MNLNINPSFKALIPPLTREEYGILRQSIDEEGCRERLVVWNGTIVDGHNRYEICRDLGVEFEIDEWAFESEHEAMVWIINNQLGRRNLTDFQRIELVEKKKDILRGKGKEKQAHGKTAPGRTLLSKNDKSDVHNTQKKLAREAGVSTGKLAQAEVLMKEAPEEIKEHLRKGDIKIGTAYKEHQEQKKSTNMGEYVTLSQWHDWDEGTPGCLNCKEVFGGVDEYVAGKEIPKELNTSQFNITNDNIDWAKYTWNPVTGCKHRCSYCYAKDIAVRYYGELGFHPALWPKRLLAPYNTKQDKENNRVFLCSMADLFGDWVPREWIQKILDVCRATPQWTYLCLTKNPKKYLEFEFPKNMWLGMTADTDKRYHESVPIARQLKEKGENLILVSMEPLKERISVKKPMPFDWVIIGGQSKTSGEPEFQPEWSWVEELLTCARASDCSVYFKPNLTVRPRELPLQGEECGHDARRKYRITRTAELASMADAVITLENGSIEVTPHS